MVCGLYINKRFMVLTILFCLLPLSVAGQTCHYETWSWNTKLKKAVNFTEVRKAYADLVPAEIDRESGCSVCREDQQKISLPNIEPFYVCKRYAQRLQTTLLSSIQSGQPIKTITGYRVGKSRGAVDESGNRTVLSNHSFGTALDINAEFNGLYENCFQFGPQCRLLRGGVWQPHINPYSLTKNSVLVVKLREAGFKWGGDIRGRQKDFMHFSLTGY